jgi:hypothetical protein
MDQALRSRLRTVVTQCRRLLEESIAQQLQGRFDIYATGKRDEVKAEDDVPLGHLNDEERQARQDIFAHFKHIDSLVHKPKESLEQLIREIAFTHLNRLCAYKMMEVRDVYVGGHKFREAVSKGLKSQGFLFYVAEHPEDEKRYNAGDQEGAYRHFLNWLGGTLSQEIGVLFSPTDPANRVYPPQRVLDEVIDLLNSEELKGIWSEDETIGWVYQYFTPKELRDQARKESAAPRNSYELAFRNQFFTPRYVVEFLTDNTLGRIWYEMRKGDTRLKDQCRYMVRRPNEAFLKEGEQPPVDAAEGQDDPSQEELLKLPVHIPNRSKKDPREIKILDPACGSAHFLLYCFVLLLIIYEEAYNDNDLGPRLQADYPTKDDLRRALPGLILRHNLHGIDIDLRCTQIAALALWLRCQKAYRDMGLKKDRPPIIKSNIVCAEPMPGDGHMLKEFVTQIEPKLLGQLVEVVFDKMKLAGEAGSLLKIEEEIRDAVAEATRQWRIGPTSTQRRLFEDDQPAVRQQRFDLSGITDAQFFEQTEEKVVDGLRNYAEQAQSSQRLRRRLFSDDAERGFAFVDICHKRFDVVLMNPPFGDLTKPAKGLIEEQYPRTKNDLYAAFVERGINRLDSGGMLGAITSRTGFFLKSFLKWREDVLLAATRPVSFADLGGGVLDTALVETAAYCLSKQIEETTSHNGCIFIRLLKHESKETALEEAITSLQNGHTLGSTIYTVDPASFCQVPGAPFAYWVGEPVRRLYTRFAPLHSDARSVQKGAYTNDDFRFLRLWWEVNVGESTRSREETLNNKRWVPFAKGGAYSKFYRDCELVINWHRDGEQLKEFLSEYRGKRGWGYQWSAALNGYTLYFKAGLTWSRRTTRNISVRILPEGCIFADKGPTLIANRASLHSLLALMNSTLFSSLVSLQLGAADAAARSYEVGVMQRIPIPDLSNDLGVRMGKIARIAVLLKRAMDTSSENSHIYHLPILLQIEGPRISDQIAKWQQTLQETDQKLSNIQHQIDEIAFLLYGINDEERKSLEAGNEVQIHAGDSELELVEDEVGDHSPTMDNRSPVADLASYLVGCILGRWDLRFAAKEQQAIKLPDPCDALPICSPGMLQGDDGFPLTVAPENYPFRIDWDGILVDDPDHSGDIIRRVREVLEVIWKDRADAIEKEACEILGMDDLRVYFRKPGKGGFWDEHISRYSRSRRKAPIYWLLQSSKKNYSLWIYYHRLDKDILFKALLNYVEPKIRREESRLNELRSQKTALGAAAKRSKKIDKDIDRQEAFLSELRDFEEKLRSAANLHLDPDLNDGVVLNIAPLRELVPWKEAKAYWDDLMDGKYEWSSIGKQLREKRLVK